MKQKKKWVIPLCVIGVILLLCAGGLWYMINHSMSFSVGRCLVPHRDQFQSGIGSLLRGIQGHL